MDLKVVQTSDCGMYRKGILEIERVSFPSPWTWQMFEQEIRRRSAHLWVLENQWRVVGYICFWRVAREIHLLNLAVHPRERLKGHARRMLESVIREGRRRGDVRIWLEVRPSNRVAQRLYARLGFQATGRRAKYYRDTGEDAIIMSLPLVQPPSAAVDFMWILKLPRPAAADSLRKQEEVNDDTEGCH